MDGEAIRESTTSESRQDQLNGSGRHQNARSTAPIWALTAFLWAAGLALYVFAVRDLAPIDAPFQVSWWMLAIAFAMTEVFVAHLKYRRDAQTYSLSEVPLLVGLCFATPAGLVVGRLLGALVALTLHRRQAGLKLAFNLGLFLLLDACLAQIVFRALLQDHLPLQPLGWAAAYLTLMVTDTLSGLIIALVTLLHQGSLPASAVRRDLAFGLLVAIVNVSFGLVAVSTLWYNPPALLLLLVVTGIMVVAYRGYVSLTSMYDRLQKLFAFTCSSGEVDSSSEVSSLALEKLRQAVKAGYVELTLLGQGDEPALRWIHDDDELEEESSPAVVHVSHDEAELLQEGHIRARTDPELQARPDLQRGGIRQVMVAPLWDGQRLAGSVLAGSRSSVGAFDQEDLSTLQTLANHLVVTLKNARLVERLRREAQEREHQALHDALTDLPNRRAFLAEVDRAVPIREAADRFALILLDLAGFRQINDTLGHQAGDKALIELSRRLFDVPDVSFAAHLGGDEFAFLMLSTPDEASALALAARLRDVVNRPVPLGSFAAQLRANVGIVLCPDHGEQAEVLLQHADMALRAAKGTPQGLALFGDEHDTSSPRRLALAADLERAVTDQEIVVAYQPQIDLVRGRVIGIEALARWTHRSYGAVSPEEFIPIAENTGVIWELTRSVLQRSLAEAGEWLRKQADLRLSVNLSVRCLHYPELPQVLDSALQMAGVSRSQLVLELTESSLMTDFARFQDAVSRLVEAGFAVSIDDFGIGYSSLAYIKSLRVSEVKIDRAFVAELLNSAGTSAIVKSVIDLTHAIGGRAVAEGVEDRSTLQRLRAMGCDVGQGFYLSRPLTPEAFRIWLPENEESIGAGWSVPDDPPGSCQLIPMPCPMQGSRGL